ncbi:hypothetical protein FRC11_013697, partial [Ceratobasidium sp. 423]
AKNEGLPTPITGILDLRKRLKATDDHQGRFTANHYDHQILALNVGLDLQVD